MPSTLRGSRSTDPLSAAFDRPATQLDTNGIGQAAVALILDPNDAILFIRRADKASDPWSGHIGLPGGHVEPGEGFRQAAVRETFEEVGLALAPEGLLGTLDDCKTPSMLPTKIVRPFVFRTSQLGPLALQPDEVASVHTIALETLLRGIGRSNFELDYRGTKWTMPCVDFDGVRLWGLTLRMVDDLLHRVDGRGYGLDRR